MRVTMRGSTPMGRGRQKAKQTKVARALKYYSPDTDYASLQRELQNGSGPAGGYSYDDDSGDGPSQDDDDQYGGWSTPTRR